MSNIQFEVYAPTKSSYPCAPPAQIALAQQDLLQQMLVLDPSRRSTITEARNHPWCRGVVSRSLKHTKAAQFTVSGNPRDDIYREAITR